MKRTFVFCLLVSLFQLAFSSAQWPNEPAGSQVLVDCPFSNSICSPLGDGFRTQTNAYASFPNAPGSPPYALDSYMPAGSTIGNGTWAWETMPFPKELYVGAWWSTNADFIGNKGAANKMIFVRNSTMDNNFLNWTDAHTLVWSMQATYDNCGHPGEFGMCYTKGDGTGGFMPNVSSGSVTAGTGWHQIEIYLKASTTKTSRDGVLRWWLDGQLVGNYPTVNMTPGGFREFYINSTWDGFNTANRDLTKSWHHYYDHLRISAPNCGTGGCQAPAYLVINSSLPTARTGAPFTATLTADGGTQPYTWFLQSGNLPAGLSLNKGVISGTPTCVGRSDFTIRVTDASQPALSATKSYTIITSGTGTCTSSLNTIGEAKIQETQFAAKAVGGKVTFSMPQIGSSNYRVSIFDLAGKKVYERKVSSNGQKEVRIDGMLKNGIYFAKIDQGQKVSMVRFNVMN